MRARRLRRRVPAHRRRRDHALARRCDFDIPAPPAGKDLDFEKVAVTYTRGDGTGTTQFGQAATSVDCQADAFYIQDERLHVCPQTCQVVRADGMAAVGLVFACESTIIVKYLAASPFTDPPPPFTGTPHPFADDFGWTKALPITFSLIDGSS